jgi:hypothetical protein
MCFSAACVATNPADVDVNHAVHLLERGLLERFRNGRAGIVHQNIQPTEGRDGLFDRSLNRVGIGGIRLNCDGLSARAFNLFNNRSGCVRALCISNRHACPSVASRLAIAAPIPREPPVTSATLPSNFPALFLFNCFSPFDDANLVAM